MSESEPLPSRSGEAPTPAPVSEGAPTDPWLVWSDYHTQWWGPDGRGYTPNILNAGIYTEEAAQSCANRRSPKADLAMPLSVALEIQLSKGGSGPTFLKHLLAEIARLSSENARLTAELANMTAGRDEYFRVSGNLQRRVSDLETELRVLKTMRVARAQVQPIIDAERQGENVGSDILDMRLRSGDPR